MKPRIANQVGYGRSCQSCKSYFVTTDANAYVCPWCLRAEKGDGVLDLYPMKEDLSSDIRMVGRVEG